MLGLKTSEELDKSADKRDYGTWLHDVLHRFHASRQTPSDSGQDAETLRRIAKKSQQDLGLTDAEFMPYLMSFESLIDRYLPWLYERDRQGFQWVEGELELTAAPEAWKGVSMFGKIDRIDEKTSPDGRAVTELIDYKTGSSQTLKKKLAEPLEATQLLFYAGLLRQRYVDVPIEAGYVLLDEGKDQVPVLALEHASENAEIFIDGIGADLDRMRKGQGLLPLGRGSVCDYCEVRGLCRRDHWSVDVQPAVLEGAVK
jgi:ATP-dependent helicase/nuclease subunit B